jgi:hypothetical protein
VFICGRNRNDNYFTVRTQQLTHSPGRPRAIFIMGVGMNRTNRKPAFVPIRVDRLSSAAQNLLSLRERGSPRK